MNLYETQAALISANGRISTLKYDLTNATRMRDKWIGSCTQARVERDALQSRLDAVRDWMDRRLDLTAATLDELREILEGES